MFIVKAAQVIIGLVGATFLFWLGLLGGFWWDNRPAHTPKIHLPLIFGCCTWEAPESLKARLQSYVLAEQAARVRAEAINRAQAAVTEAAATAETNAQAVIVTRYRTLLKEVPTYVTQAADAKCVIPVGFVVLLDGAARNDLPRASPPTGQSYGAASPFKLDDVATSVVGNYGAANENAEQLTRLQDWVRAQGMKP